MKSLREEIEEEIRNVINIVVDREEKLHAEKLSHVKQRIDDVETVSLFCVKCGQKLESGEIWDMATQKDLKNEYMKKEDVLKILEEGLR